MISLTQFARRHWTQLIGAKLTSTAVQQLAIGSTLLLIAPVAVPHRNSTAIAQQPAEATASVLGIERDDGECSITLIDPNDQIFTVTASEDICEQTLVGAEISLTYEITNVEVIPPPTVATVTDLTAGDRACYAELVDEAGKTTNQFASFEICEQDILGAEVELTYEIGNVLAFSCAGDFDCGKSDRVRLITAVNVITPPDPTAPGGTTGAAPVSFISNLPDGNYRYWSGASDNAVVSNEELLENGGITFLFSKKGTNITGTFGYVDGEAICVQGQVNENSVSGRAVQNLQGATVLSSSDEFAPFGPGQRLQVRRGRQTGGNTVRYSSALLNLYEMNRINAGTRLPPTGC